MSRFWDDPLVRSRVVKEFPIDNVVPETKAPSPNPPQEKEATGDISSFAAYFHLSNLMGVLGRPCIYCRKPITEVGDLSQWANDIYAHVACRRYFPSSILADGVWDVFTRWSVNGVQGYIPGITEDAVIRAREKLITFASRFEGRKHPNVYGFTKEEIPFFEQKLRQIIKIEIQSKQDEKRILDEACPEVNKMLADMIANYRKSKS